jgi:hypothetical protein
MLNLGRLQQLHNLSGMWYLSQKQFYQATVGRPWIITCLIFNWNSNDTLPTQIDGNHFFPSNWDCNTHSLFQHIIALRLV